MSLFSDMTLRTRYIDPVHHDANLVEFALDNMSGYTSNLRIIGLGTHRANADDYSDAVGVLGKIKAIHLESNGQRLDSLRSANRYFSFKNLLSDNESQNSIVSKDNKSARGLIVSSTKQEITPRARTACAAAAGTQAAREATLGSLNLMDCFPVLRQMMHIDTSVFKNVKIRLEYDVNVANLVRSRVTTASDSDPVPVLVAEQFQDNAAVAKMTASMGPVMWNSIEHDQIRVDEIASQLTTVTLPVETNKKLMGFNDKYVSRVVVIKENAVKTRDLDGTDVIGYGNYASQAQFEEKFNLRLNGKNMFVGAGLDSPAKMTAACSDAWGSYVLAPGDDTTSLGVNDQIANMTAGRHRGARQVLANKLNTRVGQASYIGFHIEDRIKDMQVQYSRSGMSDTAARKRYNTALNLHIYAEVRKQLIVKNGKFMVSYA